MTIGERIRTMRMSRELSQAELANLIGLKRSTIGMYERGEREPDLDTIEALADIFNVPMSALVDKQSQQTSSDDVWAAREELQNDPDRRTLLSLAKNGNAKAVHQVAAFIDMMRATNPDFYDGDDPT